MPRPMRLAPEGVTVEGGGDPGRWRAFADGRCVVQDEGSMLVARLLEPAAGTTIADVCAAPGTKTHPPRPAHGQSRARARASIRRRVGWAASREAAARLGVTIVEAVDGPVETLAPRWAGALRRRAGGRAVHESRRAPPQSRGEVAPAAGRRRRRRHAPAQHPRGGGHAGATGRPSRLRHLLARARGERGCRRTISWPRDPTFALDPPAAFPVPRRRRRLRALPAAPARHRRLHPAVRLRRR